MDQFYELCFHCGKEYINEDEELCRKCLEYIDRENELNDKFWEEMGYGEPKTKRF